MKTLIFDFDGTIADSFELVLEIAHDLTGAEMLNQVEIARLRHLPLMKVVRELHIPLRHFPRLVLQGRQKMHERIHEVQPFPGIPKALEALHGAGHHLLVISSNSEQNVRSFLRANNLEAYFDGVYGSVAVFNKASALRKVIKRNRLVVEDCFYIGDEVRDVIAASKVGVEPVAVAWGYQAPEALAEYHPFALVQKPAELLDIFGANKV
jgi:phosphoglycolate phosphatase